MRLLYLYAFCFCWLATTACSTTLSKPYLYEATKADKRLVIFGTIHIGVPDSEIPEKVHQELKNSTLAFFESDLSSLNSDAKAPEDERMELVRTIMIRPGEQTLDQRLTENEFNALAASVPKLPKDHLRFVRPQLAIALLLHGRKVRLDRSQARAFEKRKSMDLSLFNESSILHIPTVPLDEDVLEHCRASLDVTDLQTLKALLHGKSPESMLAELMSLANAYRRADDQFIVNQLQTESLTDSKCLFEERNRHWAFMIDRSSVAGDRVFIAVGVGHLLHGAGPSLLELLQESGYLVRHL